MNPSAFLRFSLLESMSPTMTPGALICPTSISLFPPLLPSRLIWASKSPGFLLP